jgi:hypothetical protein
MSLRDRQIREILDEDVKYYNEALKREFQQVRLMDESYAPPNKLERQIAFKIDEYFIELNKIIDEMITGDDGKITDLTTTYDKLIAFLDRYASRHPLNQRDLATLENKFDEITPKIEQLANMAMDNNHPQAKNLNALYNLLEARDYISLSGNTDEVLGRRQMLVDRQEAPINNPFYRTFNITPQTEIPLRDYHNIMGDRAEWNVEAEREADDEVQNYREQLRDERRQSQLEDEPEIERQPYSQQDIQREYLRGIDEQYRLLQQRLRDASSKQEAAHYADQILKLEKERKTLEDQVSMPPPKRTPSKERRERPQSDVELKRYIDSLSESQLRRAIDDLPKVKESIDKKKKGSLFARIKKNRADMNDVYTYLVEGVRATERIPTPRGRNKDPVQSESEFSATDAEYPSDFFGTDEELGFGRKSHKNSRFSVRSNMDEMRGSGEAEDAMYGLPVGFKKALDLRPIDKKPILHYNGLTLDLTLEDRMEFLNQLNTHRVTDKEFKLNSIKNLSEMKDMKHIKKGKK